jgi:hypothetical protein
MRGPLTLSDSFLKEFMWYPKLECVFFHTTKGTTFNYYKIQTRELKIQRKKSLPVFTLTLNCLWTIYETSFKPLCITFEPPMNPSLWTFELLMNMHGFCCYSIWHYPKRGWELNAERCTLSWGMCPTHQWKLGPLGVMAKKMWDQFWAFLGYKLAPSY